MWADFRSTIGTLAHVVSTAMSQIREQEFPHGCAHHAERELSMSKLSVAA
jgi:hypothetical protein